MIDIVSIDLESAEPTMTVEPLVTCGQLTLALLPIGYTLPIVPEMDDLTVGGLVNGTGIESSSHRHGLFHEQCTAYEICLADGSVVRASKDEHVELFHAIPWSYGTLGLLLSVTLRVTRCKPLVKLTYYPYTEKEAALAHFAQLSEAADAAPDFVETLAFSATNYVVMKGEQVDKPDAQLGPMNSISLWYKPWFFKHVESKLHDAKPTVEFLPLRDYYHRHSRSMFWEMELMLPIGTHPLARFLFGWALPPKVSFLKLTQSEMTRRLTQQTHVAQDFMLPMDELPGILSLCDEVYDKLYPVWLCPHVHRPMPGTIMPDPPKPDHDGSQMYVDVGVCTRHSPPRRVHLSWSTLASSGAHSPLLEHTRPSRHSVASLTYRTELPIATDGLPSCVKASPEDPQIFDMRAAMRIVESRLREIRGVEMLYADTYQTAEEFESMFPHAAYRALREKYGAVGVFPEVFSKMHVVTPDECLPARSC